MSKTPPTTIRLSDDDRALIEELKRRYGIQSTTQLIKVALRLMSERPNVATNVATNVADPKTDPPETAP